MLFDIERTTVFDRPVLRVVGELDLTTAPLLTKATDGVALQVVCPRKNSAVRLVIDLLELRAVVPVLEALPHRLTGIVGGEDAP